VVGLGPDPVDADEALGLGVVVVDEAARFDDEGEVEVAPAM
jgi:hypothetical protein